MNFPGLDQLRAHVPDLRSPTRTILIGGIIILIITLETLFFLTADRLWPFWTLDGQVIIVALAFLLISQFFRRKREYQERYQDMAYRNAFGRFVLTGLPMMLGVVAHVTYMPGPAIPVNWWTPGVITLGWCFVVVGAVLWGRAIFIFGADNLAMLYVYFPEEGRMVQSSIYSLIRHPLYAALIHLGIGLALLNGNWFAVTFALFMPLGLTGWLRLVEEKELLERFGEGYTDYRRKVPAFWPRLRDVGKFLRFLITGQ